MRFLPKTVVHAAVVLTALDIALGGCKIILREDQVREGDRVRIHYTCRSTSGELVATTDAETPEKPSAKKSALFFAEGAGEPAVLVAGPGQSPVPGKPEHVRQALFREIAEAVVGMPVGEKRTVDLTADVPPGLLEGERFLEMARVRRREKEKTMSTRLYRKFQKEREPEVGQQVILESGFGGTVTAITGETVTLRVEAQPGFEVDTLFGKGTIRDMGDHYAIEIDAREGNWVRLGNLVGRVSRVDETLITVDFGHPFGGEALECDVEVEGILMKAAEREPRVVRRADRVEVDCQVTLEDGTRVPTQPLQGGGPWLAIPEALVAGTEEVPLGIGEAVIGMAVGEKKTISLAPSEAYGPWDPEKTLDLPCVRREPRRFRMSTEEYGKKVGLFPEPEAVVNLLPYFETRVVEVSVQDSTLEHLARDGETVEEGFGTTSIRVEEEEVVLTLTPRIGAPFSLGGREGRIISTNGRTFTVDFNHPLAGKALRVELGIVSLTH